MNVVLTIAGSDCSGGAGIQADLKTILAHGAYGMSVVSALTAQNTCGVSGVMDVPAAFLEEQLEAVLPDIPPQAVKIGMLSGEESVLAVAEKLRQYQISNIVVDPVMLSTSGRRLQSERTVDTAIKELYPLAELLTPNIPEAEALAGIPIGDEADMCEAARRIAVRCRCAVLCKGGHQTESANDILYADGGVFRYEGRKIDNPNTHGTGCTLSSAIACRLAEGRPLPEAVRLAKEYLTGAVMDRMNLGHGNGPLNHAFLLNWK